MFVQIHMLQSLPPGNLNRDDTGQPKKCVFGGVTRGRISSQSLKRSIRLSPQFREKFGDALATRTPYLPRIVEDELKNGDFGVPDDELPEIADAIAARFKKAERGSRSGDAGDETEDDGTSNGSAPTSGRTGQTPQLVFFPQHFARRIAELIADFRGRHPEAYKGFIGRKAKSKITDEEKKEIERLVSDASIASKTLTMDIGLFGRMTTSDLVVNVEAACQVAHAISTHETLIESDYFTAMDDLQAKYASTQSESIGAAFIGSGETETFFNSAVYYKYFNVDIHALRKHLPSLSSKEAARAAGVFLSAAALANPTGKQNGFAAHGITELILVEVSLVKRPMSYANAFLQPVEGGTGRNLMTKSAEALHWYVDSVAAAYAPPGERALLAVGHASSPTLQTAHRRVATLDELADWLVRVIPAPEEAGATA